MYRKLFSICRIVTVTLLTMFFALNSFVIFEHFISGKTITSSSVVVSDRGKLILPALIICREKAFTIKGLPMFKLTDYLQNTMSLSYAVSELFGDYAMLENSTVLKKEHVYSINRGHCEVLKYTKELEPFKLIKIYFYPNSEGVNEDLFFYMVHPGEEYFLHLSLWKTVPFGFKLDGKTEFMDLTMAKQVEKRDASADCVDDLDYDFVGCLKQEFKEYSKIGSVYMIDDYNYTVPNCTTPWHQSMLGIHEYNDKDVNVCSSDDAYNLYYIDYDFMLKAMQGKSAKCKQSCYTIKYQGKPLDFQQDPMNMWWPLTTSDEENMTNPNETSCAHTNEMDNNMTTGNNETYASCENETDIFSNETNTQCIEEDLVANLSEQKNCSNKTITRNATKISSNVAEQQSDEEDGPLEMRFFYMYYTTADETQFTTDKLIDIATFIGSVGGTLGLYLGFSFLGMLFPLYDYAEASYKKRIKKTKY